MIAPHLARVQQQGEVYEKCATCSPHSFHGAPCPGRGCACRGPFADVPDAWLPVVSIDDEEIVA